MKQIIETNPTQVPLGTHPFHFQKQWKLYRADECFQQDVLVDGPGTVLDLRMDQGTGVVTAFGEGPPAFGDSQLEFKGSVKPDLEKAGVQDALAAFDPKLGNQYRDELDKLIAYFRADMDSDKAGSGQLARLEGVVGMRCCWPKSGSRLAELNPDPHLVRADIRLYLFEDGIKDGTDPSASRSTLLVMWAPDSPRLPINPDGTIVGTP